MPVYDREEQRSKFPLNLQEVAGYWVGDKVYCLECFGKQQTKSNRVVNQGHLDEKIYICDACGKEID